MTVRIVETPDGPALQIPAGDAARVAAAMGRLLAVRPEWASPDAVLSSVHRGLLRVEEHHAAGRGSAPGTTGGPVSDDLLGTASAALLLGVSPRAVRKRAARGSIPGAQLIEGRWMIPATVLPEREADDRNHAA